MKMALFEKGKQFPPESDMERLAKYKRHFKIFDNKAGEVFDRAIELFQGTKHHEQLKKLYITVNLPDIICTKPADMLVGQPPQYETGKADDSYEQKKLNALIDNNSINSLLHELVTSNGYRGDSFLKVRYGYRQDYSELDAYGLPYPGTAVKEPIIESVNPSLVFPEVVQGSTRTFKAYNIAWVEVEKSEKKPALSVFKNQSEKYYLNIERHIPGYIIYQKFELFFLEFDNRYGASIPVYRIGKAIETTRTEATGYDKPLVFHIPHKTIDEDWRGRGDVEKVESLLAELNEQLSQMSYILFKHSDPPMYGPEYENGGSDSARYTGAYMPLEKDDPTPGYVTWDAQLTAKFKQIDLVLGLIFQQTQTPQWLFGTITTTSGDSGGGTSHTDGAAIRLRLLPMLTKVASIKTHLEKPLREALYAAQVIENYANKDYRAFQKYDPVNVTINWTDFVPKNEKELAEIMNVRTGGKETIDLVSAIKRLDGVDEERAQEIIRRIDEERNAEDARNSSVNPSIFNEIGDS